MIIFIRNEIIIWKFESIYKWIKIEIIKNVSFLLREENWVGKKLYWLCKE